MPTRPPEPLTLLERADKWYLGGGKAAMYAPAFPKYLDTPGFWDEAYFADIRLERLYCLLLLDAQGRPLTLRRALRRWTPDCLSQIYTVEGQSGLRVHEERVVTANDTLACRLTFHNIRPEPARLHLLLWSLQEKNDVRCSVSGVGKDTTVTSTEAVERELDALSFAHTILYGTGGDTPAEVHGWGERTQAGVQVLGSSGIQDNATGSTPEHLNTSIPGPKAQHLNTRAAGPIPEHRLFVALGGNRLPDSWTVNLAETTDTAPLWTLSVFPEKFHGGHLPQEMQAAAGWNPNGLLHLALHFVVEIAPSGSDSLTVGAAIAFDRQAALDHLRADMAGDVVAESRRAWQDYFASLPAFTCDDPWLETAYWYRWYGLRLLTVDVGMRHEARGMSTPLSLRRRGVVPQAGTLGEVETPLSRSVGEGQGVRATHALPYPCIFEGIGAFRSHITYSAQCHAREASWMPDSRLAMGSLENFLANQVQQEGEAEDGFLPGHLYLWRRDRGFYHADWGAAARQIWYLTGDEDFVRRVYPGLARYADYFERERDREQSGLYDVIDQGETGQEYMSRYLFVDEAADSWRKIQVKGVDATCYLYTLYQTLALFARVLGKGTEALRWTGHADTTAQAVRTRMWDRDERLFKDVHPQTGEQSPYKAAVGFYPFLSDIAVQTHLPAFDHLDNPHTFGTPIPIPASSVDDPYFDAEAEWKDKRTNCPWNGRAWPMTTSHVAEALAHAARTLAQALRPQAADFIHRFVRSLFFDGDPKRPNCFEHYNPYTGMPAFYRGVDDYQHSCVVDLILKHVVGVQPEPGTSEALVIDPLPFDLAHFCCEGIRVRGHRVDVAFSPEEGFVVRVDGKERIRRPELERVEVFL